MLTQSKYNWDQYANILTKFNAMDKPPLNTTEIDEMMNCKHEITYSDADVFRVVCEECYEILNGRCHERQFINEGSRMNYKAVILPHCKLKYFQKKVKILDINIEYDEEWLLANFITQEKDLEDIIFSDDYDIKRWISLNVRYKFHKLLQHQGINDTEIPLLKTKHIRLEHDRIMKIVWDKLNWPWVN